MFDNVRKTGKCNKFKQLWCIFFFFFFLYRIFVELGETWRLRETREISLTPVSVFSISNEFHCPITVVIFCCLT